MAVTSVLGTYMCHFLLTLYIRTHIQVVWITGVLDCVSTHADCMNTTRLGASWLDSYNPLLFGSISLLIQAELSSCLVGWVKEIKKRIYFKIFYSKCGLVLFEKYEKYRGEIDLLIRYINQEIYQKIKPKSHLVFRARIISTWLSREGQILRSSSARLWCGRCMRRAWLRTPCGQPNA
jgi:hypothetical protein